MTKQRISKYIHKEPWKRITSVMRDYRHLKAEYEDLQRNPTNYSAVRANEIKRKITAFHTNI